MNPEMLGTVVERLDATGADDVLIDVVLAALEGDAALAEALHPEASAPSRSHESRSAEMPSAAKVQPPGAFLRSVTVTGFRGIGPTATLALNPGPGLTVVAGRNGSGKSSFAEALEVLLTGDLRRWEHRSQDWKDTWRCLHGDTTSMEAEFAVEGVNGPTLVRRTYDAEAKKIDSAATVVQPYGKSKTTLHEIGWSRALQDQRPFLSHAELEALLAEPKALHDQLNELLGLEELDGAAARLRQARLDADKVAKIAQRQLNPLLSELDGSTDPRAAAAAELLRAKAPNVDAVEELAIGSEAPPESRLSVLAQLASLTVPSTADVRDAVSALRGAARDLEEATTDTAETAASSAQLLSLALTVVTGEGACPVCETPDAIDGGWRYRTSQRVASLAGASAALAEGWARLRETVRQARELVRPVPVVVAAAAGAGVDSAAVSAAWASWAAIPSEDGIVGAVSLADHLEETIEPLTGAVDGIRTAAAARQAELRDEWAPLARRLVDWCHQARDSAAAATRMHRAKAGDEWLQKAATELRNERLAPFAAQTVELWNELRQASNVDLRALKLTGSGNRAKVNFEVQVDGIDATGLGVMSQGEANALALSVFLPRATLPGSPFGFLVIDDPIQAMDPSKVDGLARVLVRVAKTRQVVVFTHDDRLPEAMRRLALPGTVLWVSRRDRSVVTVELASDPFERLVKDARQVIGWDKGPRPVPAPVAEQVVPGILRTALESVCNDLTRRRLLDKGVSSEEVEERLSDASRLWERLSLAIHGDVVDDESIRSWMSQKGLSFAVAAVTALNKGSHGESIGDLAGMVEQTRALGRKLQELLA
jgi:recombinational DNA repair ATPase RecF